MILTPVLPVGTNSTDAPVTVRLIGMLDRVLIESFTDTTAGLAAGGSRTLIILVRDLVVMRDDSLDRFLATLDAYRAAGHRVFIDGSPSWRKTLRGLGARFEQSSPTHERSARRQVIICHSMEKRSGAA
jgi:anti-anti-sigma regulatory factor